MKKVILTLTIITNLIGYSMSAYSCDPNKVLQAISAKAKAEGARSFIMGGTFGTEGESYTVVPYAYLRNTYRDKNYFMGEMIIDKKSCEVSEGRSSTAGLVNIEE